MADAPSTAVLFDIDGTLVDSNYAHVDAWWRAFRAAGESVDAWRVHRAIGMDSGRLLEELLPDASDEVRDQAKQFHTAYYSEHMPQLRLLPGPASCSRRSPTPATRSSSPRARRSRSCRCSASSSTRPRG